MGTPRPPKYLLRFFKWFCDPDIHCFIEGDLHELYQEKVGEVGKKKADRRFALDVLLLFRPGIIRPLKFLKNVNHLDMFKHNLLISWRSFKKDRSTFLINLLGLSTGLTCALLIFMWVQDEQMMDKFHEKDAQLFQVLQKSGRPGDMMVGDWTPGPLAQALKEVFPEVEYATTVKQGSNYDGVITYEDKHIRAKPQYVEQDYFNMLTYPLLYGSKDQVLADKYAIVISEELALKLFSSTKEAVGKTIIWDKKAGFGADYGGPFTISGVFETLPSNNTMDFDVLFNYAFFLDASPSVGRWENNQASTLLTLREGTDVQAFDQKITSLIASKREYSTDYFLVKYSSQYLHGVYENGVQAGGRIQYVRLFSLISLLILLMASINFMNLSTAKASIRMKEIGVKKTLGADRSQLIVQFITESLLISCLALVIAITIIVAFLPQFNFITGKSLQLQPNLDLLGYFLGITLLTGLLSSTYPALYLSKFKPIEIMQRKLRAGLGELWVRKGLVILQFSISVILIVSVLVIYQQMNFIQSKNLGYDRENILSLKKEGALEEDLERFLSELRALPEVVTATNSGNVLVGLENLSGGLYWEGKGEDEQLMIDQFAVNYDFLETFGIKLSMGRSFSREFGAEETKVILNEAAVHSMSLEEPLGEKLTFWRKQVEVVGVTENFQYQSLYHTVRPCIFILFEEGENYGDQIWIKIAAGQEKNAIKSIASIYDQFNPGHPFEYGFVDEEYQMLYESEKKVAVLSKYFALLAILISCLGLFGLALYSVEKKKKEISVRKVLGATGIQIIGLLSSHYAKMLVVALMIALPLSYWGAHTWLSSFAFRIELEWWFFGLAILATFVLIWVSIGWQTIRAARLNPVENLSSE
ncbi:MAG: ABC transporter permease [Saprospiraceae bacterium]|nr:ABC transporter permease [Saprospiraceae bacterium]